MLDTQDPIHFLDHYDRPGFITKGSIIIYSNADARAMLLTAGTDVAPLLGPLWEQVETMGDGELFAALTVLDTSRQASICRMQEGHLFLLNHLEDERSLQALALAAQQLRNPLSETLLAIQALEELIPPGSEEGNVNLQLLRRSYFRLQRITDNMSAGHELLDAPLLFREPTELGDFFTEVFGAATTLTGSLGHMLTFHTPSQDIIANIDRQAVERCVFNLLSNALRFLPQNGQIHGELLSTANHAILRVTDNGEGLHRDVCDDLFTRYRRRPTIEDNRHGLGLGLCIVRSIVTAHGGAVYAGALPDGGSEVAITLSRRPDEGITVKSPILRPETKGLLERGRVELSRELPTSVYDHL